MNDRRSSINRLGFAIGGSALSLLAVVAARVRPGESVNYLTGLRSQALVVLLVYGVALFLVDVGGAERRRDPVLWMVRHVGAHSVAWLLSLAFAYFQGLDRLGRGIVGLFGIVNVTLFVTCGLLTDRLATRLLPKKRTIVLGSGGLVNLLVAQLLETKESPWVPVAILDAESDEGATPPVSAECSVYRHVDELRQIVDKERAECVVLVPPYKADADLYQQIARCRLGGVEVRDAVEVYEHLRGRVPLDFVAEYWALFLTLSRVAPVNVLAKRALDLTVSTALLIVSLPILAVTALLIRLLDGSP